MKSKEYNEIASTKQFGKYLSQIINEMGCSTRKFAMDFSEYCELDSESELKSVYKWCQGRGMPSVFKLYKLSRFIGKSMENLITAGDDCDIAPNYPTVLEIAYDKENWSKKLMEVKNRTNDFDDFCSGQDRCHKEMIDYAMEAKNVELVKHIIDSKDITCYMNNEYMKYLITMEENEFVKPEIKKYMSSYITEVNDGNWQLKQDVFKSDSSLFNDSKQLNPEYRINPNMKEFLEDMVERNKIDDLITAFNLIQNYYDTLISEIESEENFDKRPFCCEGGWDSKVYSKIEGSSKRIVLGNLVEFTICFSESVAKLENNEVNSAYADLTETAETIKTCCMESRANKITSMNMRMQDDNINNAIMFSRENEIYYMSMPLLNSIAGQKDLIQKFKTIKKNYFSGVMFEVDIPKEKSFVNKNLKCRILGYDFDVDQMDSLLIKYKQDINMKYLELIQKLNEDGYDICAEDFKLTPYIDESSVVMKLIEKGLGDSYAEVMDRILLNRGIYQVNDMNIMNIISMIKDSGGIAILACPLLAYKHNEEIELSTEEVTEFIDILNDRQTLEHFTGWEIRYNNYVVEGEQYDEIIKKLNGRKRKVSIGYDTNMVLNDVVIDEKDYKSLADTLKSKANKVRTC